MNSTNFVVIIPIKSLDSAKSRLRNVLEKKDRVNLIVNMFLKVLNASVNSIATKVWVISKDKMFKDIALYLNAVWVDDKGYGLNQILNDSLREAYKQHLTPIYIPSDLPFIDCNDINKAINLSNNGNDFVFSPAYNQGGTNLIIAPNSSKFCIKLGVQSLTSHTEQIIQSSLKFSYCREDGLAFDLDTVDDLNYYKQIKPDIIKNLMQDYFLNYSTIS